MTIKSIFFRDSSFIKNVAWDDDSESLLVKFNSGTTWVYFGVPENIYNSMIKATSVGAYFNKNVRDNYSSQRINYSFPEVSDEQEEKEQKQVFESN
jgi:hypothetical protein